MEQIIWAIDPFEKDLKPSPEFVHHLKEWIEHSRFEVQPVYVLSSPREEQLAVQVTSHREFLEEAAAKHFQEIGFTGFKPVQILFDGEASWQNATKKLVDFAHRQQAVALIVNSHGRAGVQRMLFGSFAENLLAQSRVPIFFLTHNRREGVRPAPLARVLFATDFSEKSKVAFDRFLATAAKCHFEIFLYHSVSIPGVASLGTGFTDAIPESFLVDQEKGARDTAARWMQQAEDRGVKAQVIVENAGFDTRIATRVLNVAREKDVGLIAMASVSGKIESVVAGSVAREICRANQVPVWVYGPQALTENPSGRLSLGGSETHLEV